MLSNRIWILPRATRAGDQDTAEVFFRCGSQQGKPARTVPADITPDDFTALTAEFVLAEASTYAKAVAKKQKNATRNLKKFFDAGDVALLENRRGVITIEEIERLLL
jgi:hypothetical protein